MAGGDRARDEALLQAGLTLASELSLEVVLQRIIELATQITGARYGALGVLGPDGRIMEFVTHGITQEQRAAIGHLPVGRGILGALIHDARILRIPEISRDPRSVGFPPNHPPMHSFLGGPVKARGRVFGNIYLTEKQGAPEFSEEDEHALEILASQAGVAVENARLHEEARHREARIEAVQEVATAILQGGDSGAVLQLVARRARQLLDADLATVAVPDEEAPEMMVLRVAEGLFADSLRGTTFPREGSISGEVMRTSRTAALDDVSVDSRVIQPIVTLGDVGPAVFVPLRAADRSFGTLLVANRVEGRAFDEDDIALIETFAGQASMALEYAKAQRELHRLAVLEDRERIAKELHDGAIQALFAVGMGLQGTAVLSRDPDLERRIEAAVAEIDRVIRDLRNYIFGLRPGILADRQLDQAIRQLGADFEERTGVTTVVDVDGGVASELTSVAADVIQLAREALSNVGRHAGAATCRVSLHRRDSQAVLEVDDDGTGFVPAEVAAKGGQGLRNLSERAASIGGSIDLRSTREEGTTVRVCLPLP